MPVSRNAIEYRPNLKVGSDGHRRASHRLCWHFDAWFKRDDMGCVYLIIEQRSGGRLIRGRRLPLDVYKVRPDGALLPCTWGEIYASGSGLVDVLVTDATCEARAALLAVHRDYVLTWSMRIPSGYKSRSVCLHYWPVPDVAAIPEGTINYCTKGGAMAGPVYYANGARGSLGTVLAWPQPRNRQ